MAAAAASGTTEVTVATTGDRFTCRADELILDAGLAAGVGLPHNCRGGACGTCKAQILEGEVDHGWVMSFAISDEEKAAGKALICQSKPRSARLVIRPDGPMAAAEDTPPAPITTPARIVAAEPLTPTIRRLVLALPPATRFRFLAGQHVEVMTPGVGKPRTYSIATAPDEEGLPPDGQLELFVRRHEHGRASGWLHEDGRLGEEIVLHGPYGSFHLVQATKGPLLCLAGGSGLAPILGIVRKALAAGYRDPVRVILSVRERREVFGLDALHALSRRRGRFSYLVTLSRAAAPAGTGWRSGRISAWLGEAMRDLLDWQVLAAGPPGFVDDCVAAAQALGAPPERILTDRFTATAG